MKRSPWATFHLGLFTALLWTSPALAQSLTPEQIRQQQILEQQRQQQLQQQLQQQPAADSVTTAGNNNSTNNDSSSFRNNNGSSSSSNNAAAARAATEAATATQQQRQQPPLVLPARDIPRNTRLAPVEILHAARSVEFACYDLLTATPVGHGRDCLHSQGGHVFRFCHRIKVI
jgi:hypothetical protein